MPVHDRSNPACGCRGLILIASFILPLISSTCTLSAPEAFFDATPDNNVLLETMNVRIGGQLWSGVIAGDLPADFISLEAKIDDGAYKTVTVEGSRWKIPIPTGAEAAAGTQRWLTGSKHTLSIRGRGANGNARAPLTFSFTRQRNKDINGDGYADTVVGASANQGVGQLNTGAAYVFYGSATGVTSHPTSASTYTCAGPPDCTAILNPDDEASASFGEAVAVAGDVNGDGFADIIVGARNNQGIGAANKGVAYIFYGSATGVTSHPTTGGAYTCSGAPDCTTMQNPDEENGGAYGVSVSAAGDVNGDGFGDVIVGARWNQGPGISNKGVVYIHYGSSTGVTNHATNASSYTCGGFPDCTAIQNPEENNSGQLGISVASAGDTNGDGYADIVVGASLNSGGGTTKGAAYIYYGSASGIASHPAAAATYTCSGPPDCTAIQNPEHKASGHFGFSVAAAGDANGDGYADVVIGAYQNLGATVPTSKGVAYIFYGSATGVTGHALSALTYSCAGPPDCTEIRNPEEENSGKFALNVSAAGDANGDGYGDVVIGASSNQGPGITDKGVAYVFYGSPAGVTSHQASGAAYSCNGPPDCTAIQNPDEENGGQFGISVNAVGDANSNGYPDLILGARMNQGGGALNKGAAYVFYGSATGPTSHPAAAAAYICSGPPDCTVIQNPDEESSGQFGNSVGFLAPALRPLPAYLDAPARPIPGYGNPWPEQFAIRREDEAVA
jgi:ssDNA-binding Zn-finger/Zn-ribbon topoisomerase 1